MKRFMLKLGAAVGIGLIFFIAYQVLNGSHYNWRPWVIGIGLVTYVCISLLKNEKPNT